MTRGLRDLAEGADRLSQGDYSTRVEVDGQDEVAHLGRSFNRMVARLKEAKEAESALEDARRNLVAWASHDLRTPLASLWAMIDAMADGVVADQETVQRYYRQSQSEIARMSDLIDDLFELAQIDAGHLELMAESSSLSDLLSDTLESFSAPAQAKRIELYGKIAEGVDPVWMAPDKIGRVLNNLIGNALVHTQDEGRIQVSANRADDSVQVEVSDSGVGISTEDLPHIFDRFYRGEKRPLAGWLFAGWRRPGTCNREGNYRSAWRFDWGLGDWNQRVHFLVFAAGTAHLVQFYYLGLLTRRLNNSVTKYGYYFGMKKAIHSQSKHPKIRVGVVGGPVDYRLFGRPHGHR